MAFFGLKLGLDLEMWEAHPHQKFQGVPHPGGGGTNQNVQNVYSKLYSKVVWSLDFSLHDLGLETV